MPDKWEQFAVSGGSADKWDQFAQGTPDPLTAQTKATARAAGASTAPAPLPKALAPVATYDPQGKPQQVPANIEAAFVQHGDAQARLGAAQQRAMRSPTPLTNASAVIYPTAAPEGVVGGLKAAGRGLLKSAAGATAGGAIGAAAGSIVGEPKQGAEIGATVGGIGAPFVPDTLFAEAPYGLNKLILGEEGVADAKAASKLAQRNADIKAGLRPGLPAPPTPPDPEYIRQKTLTEAQEAAQAQNQKFDATAKRAAEKTATARNNQYQQDAEEHMAIQKRYDDAQDARMAAEKAAKNAQLQAEQAHAKNLAEAEKARQGEITAQAKVHQIQEKMDAAEAAQREATGKQQYAADAAQQKFHDDQQASLKAQMAQAEKDANAAAAQTERLRTMHGDDLTRRGKEQAALDKAAQQASESEDSAKAELTKKRQIIGSSPAWQWGRPRSGSPTEAEQALSNLNKATIWTPEMERDAIRMWGTKARMQPGEGIVNYRARLQGYMYPGRAPVGMPDSSNYPAPSASPTSGLPSPPSAASTAAPTAAAPNPLAGVTFEQGAGIRYAVAPDGIRVSIPPRMTEAELPAHLEKAFAEQRAMQAAHRAKFPPPPPAGDVDF